MRRLIVVFATGVAVFGCESCCGGPPLKAPPCADHNNKVCQTDFECADHYRCKSVGKPGPKAGETEQCCVKSIRTCQSEADCCPGQTCPSNGECFDKCEECTDDAACGGKGERVCRDFDDDFCGPKRCMFRRCTEFVDERCPDGQFCFNGLCLADLPCGGSCPLGTVCVTQTNLCQSYNNACQPPCGPGFLAVFKDPSNIWDTCDRPTVQCECAELPPLQSNDLGRHSAITQTAGSGYISLYDGQFGDLVVATVDGATGRVTRWDWVDGVPPTGTVVAGPSGPRGGFQEPGEDVGKHTDVGVSDGTVRVAYQDVGRLDLKYAERTGVGKYGAIHLVDGASGEEVGFYNSLAFDPAGNPAIAYFMRAGATGTSCPTAPAGTQTRYLTALKLARARVPHPSAPSDWTIETADCAARPEPACARCTASEACVQQGTNTVCATKATGCSPACASDQACVGSPAACANTVNVVELAEVPKGVGLFASLAFNGSVPAVAYYDSLAGNLKVALKTASWAITTLDGQSGANDTGDVGQFPSLWVDASTYLLAYHDFTRRSLRFYSGTAFTPASESAQKNPPPAAIIDTGITPAIADGPTWVGADAALLVVGGRPFVAYQNATGVDLKLVGRDPTGGWTVAKEWKEGGVGFWADAVEVSGKILISHALIATKLVQGQAVLANRLKVELHQP